MPIQAYKNWMLDPEYQQLSIKEQRRILENYFNGKIVDDEFRSLPENEQIAIRNNFLKDHFTPDIEKRLGIEIREPINTKPKDASGQGVVENLAAGFMQGVKAPTASVVGLFDPEVGAEMQRDIQEQHPSEGAAGFVGQSLGSVVPSVLALPAGPAAAAAGLAGYYGASGAGEERIKASEARKAGEDIPTEQEFKAAIGNALIQGGGEAAMGAAYAKLFGAGGKLTGKLLPRTAKGAGLGAVVEGGEESIQQTAQNVLERETGIDPDRGAFEDVPESFLGGAIGGGFLGGAGGVLTPQRQVEDVQQDTAQGMEFAPVGVTAEDMLSGMENATDADLQQALGRAHEALGQDQDNQEKRKAFIAIKREIERRNQPPQPDVLRNQANDLRVQLVKEPDEQKRAGLLDQLTKVEQKLQASGVQRTGIGTPLQTPETVKPDTRPSATSELDVLRQESERLNTELEDSHKRSRGLQEKIAGTTNDHTKRIILIEQLAAEVQEYKSKLARQAGIELRAGELRAAAARKQLPAPPEPALQSAVDPNLITPTRGSMAESQVEAGMVENPLERGGVEASTARARQQRTVSQPSAPALEAIDLATDYGVRAETEAKINSMPRKELNALAKSLGVDSKGNVGELRQRLLKRGVDPAVLGIDRDAIRQKVEDALNNRKPPPPPAGPAGPSGPAPTKPKGPAPVSPSPQGTLNDAKSALEQSDLQRTGISNISGSEYFAVDRDYADRPDYPRLRVSDHATTGRGQSAAIEVGDHQDADFGLNEIPQAIERLKQLHEQWREENGFNEEKDDVTTNHIEDGETQGTKRVLVKDSDGKVLGERIVVVNGIPLSKRDALYKNALREINQEIKSKTPVTQETINDTQNQEGVRGAVPRGQEPGRSVQDQGPSREAPAPSGVLQAPGQGEVGEGTVSRTPETTQRKPRATKPGKPLHDMKFSTWLADALYRITGKRGSKIGLPAPNVLGSHEFWAHTDILDRYKHNDANARNRRKGELFISPARIREFTGLSPSQAKRNGDVDIQRIYDEFRADFPGFFPNVESEQNYGTDYEREAIKAFMDILKSSAPTILDAAKQNRVTILDESMLADELLAKHQSEEEAEFEAWLDEHPEARKRIEDEKAKRSRAESLSEEEAAKEGAINEALEALQSEGYPADAIDRDTVEILVDYGYTTDEIFESFARDQGELDASLNPDEFEDAFSQAVDAFLEEKASPKPVKPQQETPEHLEPPDAKGNQQSTFVDYEEDDKGLLGGLFSRTKPVAAETILQEAKDTLGTTEKLTEAGFVLPDGTLIVVPQRGGKKSWYTAGHKWIASLIPSLQDRVSALTDFMEAGAIRIDYQPGGGSTIEIRGVPTAKQQAVLTRMIEGSKGAIPVDMIRTLPDGSLDMYSGWYTDSKTLAADAKSFASGRLKMTGSLIQQFHQSDGTHWAGRRNKVQGMGVLKTARAVAPLGYELEVVKTINDLPPRMRKRAAKLSRDGFNIEGAYDPETGVAYLVASNISSAKRAVEVALHESIGHGGLRGALRGKLNTFLSRMALSKEYRDKIKSLSKELKIDRLEAAEEFFAKSVEDGTIDQSWWSKFVGAFRAALRGIGIELEFTSQDLKRLVRMAHKAAQLRGDTRTSGARFSATKPATEYDRLYNGLLEGGATPDEAARWVEEMGVTKDTPLSKPAEATETTGFSIPEQTALQKLGQTFWNKFNRLEQIQDIIGKVAEDQDAVMANELLPGRSGNEILDFSKKVIDPILKRLAHAKLTLDDLGVFLYAKHAKERNEHIERKWADIEKIPKKYREIIDVIRTQGSGMTNEEAQAILDLYKDDKVIQELAKEVWAYEQKNRDRRLDAGLLTEEEHHVLSTMFDFYVPLKRDKNGKSRMRTGKGLSVSGPEIIQAWGRTTPAQNPFVQSTLDTVEAIVRSEKNQAIESLAKLIEANPNEDLWTIHEQKYIPYYNEGGEFQGTHPSHIINENQDVEFKRNGKQFIIKIHDEALVRAYKNLGVDQVKKWIQVLQKYNGLLRKSITTWSVQFGLTNFERDFQTAMIHLAGEIDPKIAKAVAKDIRKAMRGVWRNVRDKSTQDEWSKAYDELRKLGGVTGWFAYDNFEQKVKRLENELKQFNESPTKAIPRKLLKPLGQLLEDYNQSIENAVRLSAYVHLVKNGYSKQKAAQYAKNVTVNFDKKGLATNTSGALYLFSNAAIGGAMRSLLSLAKHKGTRKIVAGITATAFLSTLLNRLVDDDDEYDKITPYNRDMNLLIPVPGLKKHVAIRASYGYNVFNALGNVMADMLVGKETVMGGAKRVLRSVDQGFNPLGAGSLIQTVIPTIGDPWVQILENKNFAGNPIYKEQPPYQPKVPDSELYFKSARTQTVALTKWLNAVTGGSEKVSKFIDINPEVLDHLLDSYTGGVGKLMGDTVDTLATFAKMELPEAHKAPILQVMVKGPSASFARSRALDTLAESGRTIFGEIDTQRFRDDMKYAFEKKIITAEQYSNYLRRFTKNQAEAKASLGKIKSERKQERPAQPERTERRDRPERPTRKIGLGMRPPVTIGSFA